MISHFFKPGFHIVNYDHDNYRFRAKTKRLVGWMTAQAHNRVVFGVVVIQFAVNGNHALRIFASDCVCCVSASLYSLL